MSFRGSIVAGFAAFLTLLWQGCSEEHPSEAHANLAPETFVAIDSVGTVVSSQVMVHWWGDDPDGLVKGFLVTWDGVLWTWTTSYDSLFSLDLVGADTILALFRVSAVDLEGNGMYDNAVTAGGIDFGGEPFTDTNGNGVYDPGEPFVDLGAIDPTPAQVRYTVKNTPPTVVFQFGSDIPSETLPVASFLLEGSDIDGSETISSYLVSLNDTANWTRIPGNAQLVTLVGDLSDPSKTEVDARVLIGDKLEDIGVVVPGMKLDSANVFYAYAQDLAGALSDTVRMPSAARTWLVKRPVGRRKLLLVDDFAGGSPNPDQKYAEILAQVTDGQGETLADFDRLDIKTFPVPAGIGRTMIFETMRSYKAVLWYADRAPNLNFAQNTIPQFLDGGGKIVFTTGFVNFTDNRGIALDFAPIDSLLTTFFDSTGQARNGFVSRVFQGSKIVSQDSAQFPHLFVELTTQSGVGIYGVEPSPPPAQVIYRLDQPRTGETWVGTPAVCVLGSRGDIVFATVPLHLLNGIDPGGVPHLRDFFQTVIQQQFGL